MNECIIVKKANKVTGEIEISGAKNSAVAILPALILSNGIITIDSLPNILDIKTLIYILNKLNVKCNKLSKNR